MRKALRLTFVVLLSLLCVTVLAPATFNEMATGPPTTGLFSISAIEAMDFGESPRLTLNFNGESQILNSAGIAYITVVDAGQPTEIAFTTKITDQGTDFEKGLLLTARKLKTISAATPAVAFGLNTGLSTSEAARTWAIELIEPGGLHDYNFFAAADFAATLGVDGAWTPRLSTFGRVGNLAIRAADFGGAFGFNNIDVIATHTPGAFQVHAAASA